MPEVRDLILVGGGGTCADVLALIRSINQFGQRFRVLGILDDGLSEGSLQFGLPVLGGILRQAEHTKVSFVDCLGSPLSYRRRPEILERAGFDLTRFETIIHPSVFLSEDVSIQPGSIIYPNAVLLSNVKVGAHVTILSSCVLNHDVQVGSWTIIASGVVLSGSVRLGRNCYIGAASAVKENIIIGDGSLVGLGSAVVNDVLKDTLVAGVPARYLRMVS